MRLLILLALLVAVVRGQPARNTEPANNIVDNFDSENDVCDRAKYPAEEYPVITCACNEFCGDNPYDENRMSKCTTCGGCIQAVQYDGNGKQYTMYKCLSPDMYMPRGRPLTCSIGKNLKYIRNAGCCHDRDFCNKDLNVTLPIDPNAKAAQSDTEGFPSNWVLLSLTVLLAALFIVLVGVVLLRRKSWVRRPNSLLDKLLQHICPPATKEQGQELLTLPPLLKNQEAYVKDMIENIEQMPKDDMNMMNAEITIGSGSGVPSLTQRSVARQVRVDEADKIGCGRFGIVYRGLWQGGQEVAVKIFHAREEQSWFREIQMYQTTMLRHENLLGFIAADNKDAGLSTQLWIITEFHRNGSLYDYLGRTTIQPQTMVRFLRSIASGLAHLHQEITGVPYSKPSIAHRDLKSKNVLVKSDLTCCIGDMGMAARYDSQSCTIDVPQYSAKCGTKRYLAPEILNGQFNEHQFDAYKNVDVYAFSLLVWEVLRRTEVNSQADAYELPYFDDVPCDPTAEQMRRAVCDEGRRPRISEWWSNDPAVAKVMEMMRECWAANPAARLPALRIRKTLDGLVASTGTEESSLNVKA